MKALVLEDDFGITHCEQCGAEILSNDCGDMPDICPKCGAELDYSLYEREE